MVKLLLKKIIVSILNTIDRDGVDGKSVPAELKIEVDKQKGIVNELSEYNPSEEERLVRQMVVFHFALGYTNMYRPRVEFNDLSTIARDQTDFLAWNTYQPNNGDPYPGDVVNGWRSNAIRPIERNKAISIAAHATARMLFPKVFAFDEQSDYQENAAKIIEDLMEWSAERYDYSYTALQAVIQALVSPASIVYSEYTEVMRNVKDKKVDNKWQMKKMLDENLSGFRDTIVRTDQFYIENFFEPDLQKQGWVIWRRVQDHRLMEEKYGHLDNWKYVRPGMQVLFNDANQGFYYVYDPNMRQYQDEEVLYWNKSMDVFLVLVNGVMVTPYDNPNPRWDKQYPFSKFGYELINNTCFYYKSLVFKISHDAGIVNTLYPMIIDGTYLNIMPPFLNRGGEMIASDVIVPGQVTTLSDPNSELAPIKMASDIRFGLEALQKVEESLASTSPLQEVPQGSNITAYQISKAEQEKNIQLGLFVQMIGNFIRQFGKLRLNDILQHLTVAQADKISDNPELVYKTFVMDNKERTSKARRKKIQFTDAMPDYALTENEKLTNSYKTLEEQGGSETDTELWKANPRLLRNLTYMLIVSPDVLNPRSEDVERQYLLEAYDRAIQNPTLDQDQVTRDFLLSAYQKSAKNPDKYMKNKNPQSFDGMMQMSQQMAGQVPGGPAGVTGLMGPAASSGSGRNEGVMPGQTEAAVAGRAPSPAALGASRMGALPNIQT